MSAPEATASVQDAVENTVIQTQVDPDPDLQLLYGTEGNQQFALRGPFPHTPETSHRLREGQRVSAILTRSAPGEWETFRIAPIQVGLPEPSENREQYRQGGPRIPESVEQVVLIDATLIGGRTPAIGARLRYDDVCVRDSIYPDAPF